MLDTFLDAVEIMAGTDPLDPLSYPGAPSGFDPLILVIIICGIGIIVMIIGFRRMRGEG